MSTAPLSEEEKQDLRRCCQEALDDTREVYGYGTYEYCEYDRILKLACDQFHRMFLKRSPWSTRIASYFFHAFAQHAKINLRVWAMTPDKYTFEGREMLDSGMDTVDDIIAYINDRLAEEQA